MASQKKESKILVESLSLGFLNNCNNYEYWAYMFGALLRSLLEHKNHTHKPSKILQRDTWSLMDLKGITGIDPICDLRNYLQNWAFEILLCNALNRNHFGLMDKLLENLRIFYGDYVQFSWNAKAKLCAADNTLGERNTRQSNAVIMGSDAKVCDPQEKVQYADLEIEFTNPQNEFEQASLVGEVEGNHGEKLGRDSYWRKKACQHSRFAIGIHDTESKTKTRSGDVISKTFLYNDRNIVLLIINASVQYIRDFRAALQYLTRMLREGFPNRNVIAEDAKRAPGLEEVIKYIFSCWEKPVISYCYEMLPEQPLDNKQTVILTKAPLLCEDIKLILPNAF